MNTTFLGDALDHWKGSLFESLQKAGVLTHFAVDPLASDFAEWEQEDFDLYARLLKVRFRQVLQHKMRIADNRYEYFKEISHAGDLFIDPDIGVATGRVRHPMRYVMPAEIGRLLDHGKKRIVALYQHVHGKRVVDRVKDVLRAIGEKSGEFQWSSYESGTVAMLFLSRDHHRAEAVSKHFRRILGLRADGRIRCGVESGHGHA